MNTRLLAVSILWMATVVGFSSAALAQSSNLQSPPNLEARITDAGVLVTWDAVAGAAYYDVYALDSGQRIAEGLVETQYLDTAPATPAGYFAVSCEAIRLCSSPGGSVRPAGSLVSNGIDGDPSVPQAVTYTLDTNGGATINFEPVVGAIGYLLHINRGYVGYSEAGTSFDIDEFDINSSYQISAHIPDAKITHPGMSLPAVAAGDPDAGTDELAVALNRIAELESQVDSRCRECRAGPDTGGARRTDRDTDGHARG